MSSFINTRRLSSTGLSSASPPYAQIPTSSSPSSPAFFGIDSSGSYTSNPNTGTFSIRDSVFGELVSEEERDEIVRVWEGVHARGKFDDDDDYEFAENWFDLYISDIVENKVVIVDASISVEEACDVRSFPSYVPGRMLIQWYRVM